MYVIFHWGVKQINKKTGCTILQPKWGLFTLESFFFFSKEINIKYFFSAQKQPSEKEEKKAYDTFFFAQRTWQKAPSISYIYMKNAFANFSFIPSPSRGLFLSLSFKKNSAPQKNFGVERWGRGDRDWLRQDHNRAVKKSCESCSPFVISFHPKF